MLLEGKTQGGVGEDIVTSQELRIVHTAIGHGEESKFLCIGGRVEMGRGF